MVPEGAALSRSRIAALISAGRVARGAEVVTDPAARALPGEVWMIRRGEPAPATPRAQAIALVVVHEDDDLIVIDKPVGMVVHPAPGAASGTLVNALLHHCGDSLSGIGGVRRPGIVHRIDKDTSGLLVVAKNDRAHHDLAAQFAAHSVNRHYLALCHGLPDPASRRLAGLRGIAAEAGGVICIATRLARHPHDRQRQAVTLPPHGRGAVTRLRVVEAFGEDAALVDCWLETGRTHQIRVHLAYAGHGIIGDPVYGGARRLSVRRLGGAAELAAAFPCQALHAATLGFTHPATGERVDFRSPMPADMVALVVALREGMTQAGG